MQVRYLRALLFFLILPIAGCSILQLQPAAPSATPNWNATIGWMVDDAMMKMATKIIYDIDRTFAARYPTLTPEPPTLKTFPSATPKAIVTPVNVSKEQNNVMAQVPQCLDELEFMQDITIPDGTVVLAGKPFTKTWRIRNKGTCIWNDSYHLVYYEGDKMSGLTSINLPSGITVTPNDTVTISVYMTAPLKPGRYAGFWMLENGNGVRFGAGPKQDKALWVKVEVK